MEAKTYIDPKGSASIIQQTKDALSELMQGRTAYGEWMRHLLVNDRPPRGKCSAYFQSNANLRKALAGTSEARTKRRSILAKLKIGSYVKK